MKFISHRGNIDGPNKDKENHPSYIKNALKIGYEAEIDVWYIDNKWYLGHDEPQHEVKYDFLTLNGLWIHAKNGDAFFHLLQDLKRNVFWHTNEDWILTSKKYIWTFPNKLLYINSICVLPELGYQGDINKCYGICSDYIEKYRIHE
jgi:hypothetical protein